MARNLGLDDVVDHFTLVGDELELLRNKSGATRLGFAVLLKYVMWRGRFPTGSHELADDAVAHLARQVRVPADQLASYDFASRTAQRHRTEIRAYTSFRECSVTDAEALASWLAEHVAQVERREDRVREQLLARCHGQLIEPPTPDRVSEITRSALHRAERALLGLVAARVDAAAIERHEARIAVGDDDDGDDVLALIKAAPGNVSLDTMLVEIAKLDAIRAIGLPSGLFADVAPIVVAGWRARAAVESPSHLREHPQPTKLALLCALLMMREREVTDTLAQLLIATIHRINAHAEQKVVAEFVKDFRSHKQVAKELKGARFVLWKNAHRLTERQQHKLAHIQQTNKPLYRAYLISQQLREIYGVTYQEAMLLLDAWLAWARRCRLAPFVKLAKTITKQRPGIEAAIRHGLSNARIEQVNTQLRLITRRAYGFHTPQALIALAMLSLGGLCPPPPQ